MGMARSTSSGTYPPPPFFALGRTGQFRGVLRANAAPAVSPLGTVTTPVTVLLARRGGDNQPSGLTLKFNL